MKRNKVLLVDDLNLILELEKVYLKGLPVDVYVAGNGEQALEIVSREKPDLIYMDLNMPVMDGPTCCRILKSDPTTREIPVIMVTSASSPQDELQCRSAGCDDFMTKPIDSHLFLEKGRRCIADFERRRRRYNYETDVSFLVGGEPRYGMTTDVSRGGLFPAIPNSGMPDDPVDLSFTLGVEERRLLVAARGRIVWQNPHQSPVKPVYPAGVGVQFTDIEAETVIAIERFFQEALPADKV